MMCICSWTQWTQGHLLCLPNSVLQPSWDIRVYYKDLLSGLATFQARLWFPCRQTQAPVLAAHNRLAQSALAAISGHLATPKTGLTKSEPLQKSAVSNALNGSKQAKSSAKLAMDSIATTSNTPNGEPFSSALGGKAIPAIYCKCNIFRDICVVSHCMYSMCRWVHLSTCLGKGLKETHSTRERILNYMTLMLRYQLLETR